MSFVPVFLSFALLDRCFFFRISMCIAHRHTTHICVLGIRINIPRIIGRVFMDARTCDLWIFVCVLCIWLCPTYNIYFVDIRYAYLCACTYPRIRRYYQWALYWWTKGLQTLTFSNTNCICSLWNVCISRKFCFRISYYWGRQFIYTLITLQALQSKHFHSFSLPVPPSTATSFSSSSKKICTIFLI